MVNQTLHSISTLYPNKITVSNKLLGLSRVGLGSGFILYAWNDNSNKLLELLNVVINNLIGLQLADRLKPSRAWKTMEDGSPNTTKMTAVVTGVAIFMFLYESMQLMKIARALACYVKSVIVIEQWNM